MEYLGCSGVILGFLIMGVAHLWMLSIVHEENDLMGGFGLYVQIMILKTLLQRPREMLLPLAIWIVGLVIMSMSWVLVPD